MVRDQEIVATHRLTETGTSTVPGSAETLEVVVTYQGSATPEVVIEDADSNTLLQIGGANASALVGLPVRFKFDRDLRDTDLTVTITGTVDVLLNYYG